MRRYFVWCVDVVDLLQLYHSMISRIRGMGGRVLVPRSDQSQHSFVSLIARSKMVVVARTLTIDPL